MHHTILNERSISIDNSDNMTDKRTAILNATLNLISANGFHGTAMSKVAKEAEVSAGIIYHYFDNKEDLIDKLYLQIKFDLSQALLVGYSEKLSIRENFGRIWLNTLNFHLERPKETAFLEQYENSPFVKPETQQIDSQYFEQLLSFVQKAMDEKVIKTMPLAMFAALTIEVAMSLAKKHSAGTIKLDDELTGMAIESCWNAIKI